MQIHIFWEGPWRLEDLPELDDRKRDYGLYQIYGSHPIYGSSVLLYIGKAEQQTFATRISQEEWEYNDDNENVEIYVGRIAVANKITEYEWAEQIDQAEKLLIFAHAPAYNTQNTKTLPEEQITESHVYNWENKRSLFPEVSGRRHTSYFDYIVDEHIVTTKKIR